MTHDNIRNYRLYNQQITAHHFANPQEVVGWMGAMQAQEYAMAKWAIGLRLNDVFDQEIEQALNSGHILRTHLLRPTWHFVSPANIRWLLKLTGPRVQQINAFWYRKLNYDSYFLTKTNDILANALEGKKYLTRTELQEILKQNNIHADGVALSCIMMHAELDGIICSGPRKGKQFTYALLEERVPKVNQLTRQEALYELCRLYYTSRGPASLKDFMTWSGLTMKDAREGAGSLSCDFKRETIDGQEFIFLPNDMLDLKKPQPTFLMPDYDEYGMSYKDRSVLISLETKPQLEQAVKSGNYHLIIIEGMIAGTWKRIVKGKNISVETTPFQELNKMQKQALDKAEDQFLKFSNS